MPNSIAYALLNDEKGRILVAQSKNIIRKTEEEKKIEQKQRIEQLKKLVYDTRIPNLEAGFRHAREYGYMGGEDFEEACAVLKHARVSREDWETALACFNK